MNNSISLPCAHCGKPAATFSLYLAGTGEGFGCESDRLVRTGFMGEITKFGSLDSLSQLFVSLQQRDYNAARQHDPDFIAFHCWECGQDYCEQCWDIGPMEFDDGFYDCTRATCPEGHEQMVDD